MRTSPRESVRGANSLGTSGAPDFSRTITRIVKAGF
jgi:hypothetical protein